MLGFAKQLRLNQAADYRRLFRIGKKLNTQYFAIYSFANQLAHPRLGLVIAKKAARSAVKRNQIKRVIRESVRLNQVTLVGLDVMIVAYKGIDTLSKPELREYVERGWLKVTNYCEKA